ncbi:MAG: tetratricopeptide repeat protein [Candidatus Polarisedimenticolia bacterium]
MLVRSLVVVLFPAVAAAAVPAAAVVPATTVSCSACFRASDPLECHQVAVSLAMARDFRQAIAIEEHVRAALPANPEVAAALAKMYRDGTRNVARSVEMYRTALYLRPGYPPALMGLGTIMQDTGQTEVAARYYERAARENPAEPLFKMRLAETLVRLGREADAEPILREIVQRWPGTPEADSAKTLMPRSALAKP